MHPFLIPVSRTAHGEVTGFLRWPSPETAQDLPLVRTTHGGLQMKLLATSTKSFLHRALADEDHAGGPGAVAEALGDAAEDLYPPGDVATAKLPTYEAYLTTRVGKFPDVIEGLSLGHLARGDETSGLVAAEWYMKKHFLGWARPFVFNAEVYERAGRVEEMRDCCQIALRNPWWTLGADVAWVVERAGFRGDSFDDIKFKLSEEGVSGPKMPTEEVEKAPEVVAIERAAFRMDKVVSGEMEGSQGPELWDAIRSDLAFDYAAAGLKDVSKLISAV